MPMYCWEDRKTGYKIDLLKTFAEYRDPPTDDDLPEAERGKEREWTKIIAPVGGVNFWPNSGGPGKGSWGR